MAGELGMLGRNTLQGLLGDIGDGVILTDAEERVVYLNRAARQILSCNKLTPGTLFKDICPLLDLASGRTFESPIRQAIRERKSIGLARNVGIMRSDGAAYLSATVSPIFGPNDEPQGCSIMLRDVTRLRRVEMKLETNHVYMRAIFEAARVGLCVLDSEGAVIDANNAALEIMDVYFRDIAGVQFGDAFHCENSYPKGCGHGPNCRHCPIRKNLEAAIMDDDFTGDFTVAMFAVKSETRHLVWLHIFISQVFLESGKQIIVAMLDVTERKKKEKDLEQARQDAENACRAKGMLLANMSHELRTPINGMNGMMDLVLATELTETQRENLLRAKQCASDLLSIVNDILDFSTLESGHVMIEERAMDLYTLLREVLDVNAELARQRGLLFAWPRLDRVPRFIKGDPLRIRQVLRNLLANAIKFTLEGTVLVHVETGERDGRETLEISVHDTGVGMPLEEAGKMFRPFHQADGSETREFGGTGLGLAIVRELVEAMHGRVWLHTAPLVGTAVCFWIPLVRSEPPKAGEGHGHTVFLNPMMMGDSGRVETPAGTDGDDDIAYLVRYCEKKLAPEGEGGEPCGS